MVIILTRVRWQKIIQPGSKSEGPDRGGRGLAGWSRRDEDRDLVEVRDRFKTSR
jgi:hypothetical protein